jgi:hypothetical protein
MEPFISGSGRQKGNGKATKRRVSSKKAGKQPAGIGKSRHSPRKRQVRDLSGRATEEEVRAALQSPERMSSPEFESIEGPGPGPSAPAEANNEVTSDILPPWGRGSDNPYRATVSDVTDEGEYVRGFVYKQVQQLDAEMDLDPVEASSSTHHMHSAAASAPVQARAGLTGENPQPSLIEVKPPVTTRQPSPITLLSPSPEPQPEGSSRAEDERQGVSKDIPKAPAAAGQARVEFLYRVVCRHPRRQMFSWKPEGSFRDMSLARLERDLSEHLRLEDCQWSQFHHLHFRLAAPNTRAEQLVRRGREDQFDAVKKHLAGFIRECIVDTPCGKTVFVEIDIEPLVDVNSVRKPVEQDVMDFEW